MGFRRKGREYALQLLFQADVGERARREAVSPTRFEAFWAQRNASPDVRAFAEAVVVKRIHGPTVKVACVRRPVAISVAVTVQTPVG